MINRTSRVFGTAVRSSVQVSQERSDCLEVLHVGAGRSPKKVDGVNATVWNVAGEQARLGYRVGLLLSGLPDADAVAFAKNTGVELIAAPVKHWHYAPAVLHPLLRLTPPRIIHMHSVFVPQQATLASQARYCGIPYIITPHGGLSPNVLRRGRLSKWVYSNVLEKRRFGAAAAITTVMPQEEIEVRDYVDDYAGDIPSIPNPIDVAGLESVAGNGARVIRGVPRLVYLGRFDVEHKGIDLLVQTAQLLPDVEVHLYGRRGDRTAKRLDALLGNLPPTIAFHEPVFGEDKVNLLGSSTMYIQMSRWEAFGISVAEAMYLGVPCAISETMNLAELFGMNDLGLVLPADPLAAAERITEALSRPESLLQWSKNGQEFARKHFHPRAVAQQYLDVYDKVIEGERSRSSVMSRARR